MSATAMIPLRNALAALVSADLDLATMLAGRKVYAGLATQGASLAYLVIGQVLRDTDGSYANGQAGRLHKRRLSVWARTSWTCEEIMARLIVLLDNQRLTVAGHTIQTAALDVVFGPVVEDGGAAWGLHADWSVRTLAAAA